MTIEEGHNKVTIKLQKPGDQITSDQKKIVNVSLKQLDDGSPLKVSLRQDYSCCDDPSYHYVMKHNRAKIELPLLEIEVSGGCSPYTWQVAGGVLGFDITETEYPSNFIRIFDFNGATDPEGDLVTVTDACGNSVTCLVRVCPLQEFDWESDWIDIIPCESTEYVEPTLRLQDIYDGWAHPHQYTVIVTPLAVIYRPDGGKNYLIDSVLKYLGVDEVYSFWLWKQDGSVVAPGTRIKRYNDDFDILEPTGYILNLRIGYSYVGQLNWTMCGCTSSALYSISDGTPPFKVEIQRGGNWETLYEVWYPRVFTFYGFSPDCGNVIRVRCRDLCGNYTNNINLNENGVFAEGVIWHKGRDNIYEIDSSCTGKVKDFAFQLFYQNCAKNFWFEADGNYPGELEVEYKTKEVECVDGAGIKTTQTIQIPVSASFKPGTLDYCCQQAGVEFLRLYVCDPGDLNRKLLDSVKINIIPNLTEMTWDNKSQYIIRGGEEYFAVSGGRGPYTWEIVEINLGYFHKGFWFDWTTAMYKYNYLNCSNSIGCGTVKIRVTDSCGQILEALCTCVTESAWINVASNSWDAWTAVRQMFFATGLLPRPEVRSVGWYGTTTCPDPYGAKVCRSGNYTVTYQIQFVEQIMENKQSISWPPIEELCNEGASMGLWQLVKGTWAEYIYEGGLPRFYLSAAQNCSVWRGTGWNYWNEERPCCNENSYTPHWGFTWQISQMVVRIWGC